MGQYGNKVALFHINFFVKVNKHYSGHRRGLDKTIDYLAGRKRLIYPRQSITLLLFALLNKPNYIFYQLFIYRHRAIGIGFLLIVTINSRIF